MTIEPVDLFGSAIHIRPSGDIRVEGRMFDPRHDGWQLMAFHVHTNADVHADHWEIHTEADELVSCLTGQIRLHLRPQDPAGTEEQITVPARTAAIVPRGRWHRIELDAPSDIIAVTLPRGSHLEKREEFH